MSYKSILTESNLLFFLSDTEVLDLSTYEQYKKLIGNSQENKAILHEEIKNGLISSVNEEINLLIEKVDENRLYKTFIYARLLELCFHYQKMEIIEEENTRRREEQEKFNEEEIY
jgi:hypothetical protein